MTQTDTKDADLAGLMDAGWTHEGNRLGKKFVFKNFGAAFAFMTLCATEVEKLDHHPAWSNDYNRVIVNLSTHDAGGVTGKDVELAKIMDTIAARFLAQGK